jgi:hypothetical protein
MFVNIQAVDQVGGRLIPRDADIVAVEHRAQSVAHEIHNALEIEVACNALLDAADDGQLGVALRQLLT